MRLRTTMMSSGAPKRPGHLPVARDATARQTEDDDIAPSQVLELGSQTASCFDTIGKVHPTS